MIDFNANELTDKQRYKFLTGSVVPRPIAWVTSKSKNGIINAAPFSYFSVVVATPALISISINRIDGQMKDTAKNILTNREAVVQTVEEDTVKQANQTSASLPPETSEISANNIPTEKSDLIQIPRIKNAKIQLETVLYKHIPVTYKNKTVSDLFILEVIKFHFAEDVFKKDKEYLLAKNLKPVSRLAGFNYGKLGDLFSIVRPK